MALVSGTFLGVNGSWRICFVFRKGDAYDVEIVDYHTGKSHAFESPPGRLLRRELAARGLSANRLASTLPCRPAVSRIS